MSNQHSPRFVLVACLLVIVFAFPNVFAAEDWRPVTPEELSMTKGKVEADADAEAIFWEITVDDASADLVMRHYVRVKIFNERGRDKFSKVDIPYIKGIKIKEIEARVIKPDGTIVELAKDDVFDREIVKGNDVKVKAKSFAVPNIEPGVIVEYRYKEIHRKSSANHMRMVFQRDIPMQYVAYYFKPYGDVRYLTFNMSGNKFEKVKGNMHRAELSNVPAMKEEPYMPPEDEVRSWMLVYYMNADENITHTDIWSSVGYYVAKAYEIKDTLKPGKKMRAAAEEIIGSAATDEEKIKKLYDFCVRRVKNLSFSPEITETELDEIKLNSSDDDTYKKLQGRSEEVNKLFASLADAAGFETRLAFTGDRSEMFFNPRRAHASFIHLAGVAVEMNGRWHYFDPGDPFVPYGTLAWYEENTSVFLLAYKDYITTTTPMLGYRDSKETRKGDFTLNADGTLEGTVSMEYTGHLSYRHKLRNFDVSENQREEFIKEEIKSRMSTAEVSAISIENLNEPDKPIVYRYKLRIPNFAQKTGSRLFIQPGVFEYGTTARLASDSRTYDVYFPFPWSESDDITIRLPEGFEIDSGEKPAPVADSSGIGSLTINIGIEASTNLLKYKREFHFGGGGNIFFPVESYKPVKTMFDLFHKADTHTITLKKIAAE
ncbi:MAG: DUF3857 and transglutaminase domain-containing protein [Aridibacter famidurans]|nr:DUF3857 and transglutaminase domain-containing protein [Aridibacter famidurans]